MVLDTYLLFEAAQVLLKLLKVGATILRYPTAAIKKYQNGTEYDE